MVVTHEIHFPNDFSGEETEREIFPYYKQGVHLPGKPGEVEEFEQSGNFWKNETHKTLRCQNPLPKISVSCNFYFFPI